MGAAITALQQLEGAVRKADPRLDELGAGSRTPDVRSPAISQLPQSTAMMKVSYWYDEEDGLQPKGSSGLRFAASPDFLNDRKHSIAQVPVSSAWQICRTRRRLMRDWFWICRTAWRPLKTMSCRRSPKRQPLTQSWLQFQSRELQQIPSSHTGPRGDTLSLPFSSLLELVYPWYHSQCKSGGPFIAM